MNPQIQRIGIKRYENTEWSAIDDAVAIEEPLEIRLEYGVGQSKTIKNISITMRTPGNDAELAAGFLYTEGLIKNLPDITDIRHVQTLPGVEGNYIQVSLNPESNFDISKLDRHFYTSSSCGVCGKSSLDAIKSTVPDFDFTHHKPELQPEIIAGLPDALRQAQNAFDSTGGIHASGLFDMKGNLLALREDVGRHNALDKLIGWGLLNNQLPFHHKILLLSGRASFELLQKSAMAGIQVVCAVGAPSSLAVECAKEFNITLIGFLRGQRFNQYA